MVDKSSFTPDEWNTLLASPLLAGMAVTMAEPSGLWGMIQEGMATARSMLEAKSEPGAGPLAKAVAEELSTSQGRTSAQEMIKSKLTGKTAADLKQQIIASLKTVTDLLDQKAPAEATPFKAWLKHVSETLANASSEGGFLGFGGVDVSDAEKATLSEIAGVLKV